MTRERAVEWMAEHGRPGYRHEVHAFQATIDEITAEAGRYGHLCPITQDMIAKVRRDIAECQQAALDRYEDWASD